MVWLCVSLSLSLQTYLFISTRGCGITLKKSMKWSFDHPFCTQFPFECHMHFLDSPLAQLIQWILNIAIRSWKSMVNVYIMYMSEDNMIKWFHSYTHLHCQLILRHHNYTTVSVTLRRIYQFYQRWALIWFVFHFIWFKSPFYQKGDLIWFGVICKCRWFDLSWC